MSLVPVACHRSVVTLVLIFSTVQGAGCRPSQSPPPSSRISDRGCNDASVTEVRWILARNVILHVGSLHAVETRRRACTARLQAAFRPRSTGPRRRLTRRRGQRLQAKLRSFSQKYEDRDGSRRRVVHAQPTPLPLPLQAVAITMHLHCDSISKVRPR